MLAGAFRPTTRLLLKHQRDLSRKTSKTRGGTPCAGQLLSYCAYFA